MVQLPGYKPNTADTKLAESPNTRDDIYVYVDRKELWILATHLKQSALYPGLYRNKTSKGFLAMCMLNYILMVQGPTTESSSLSI